MGLIAEEVTTVLPELVTRTTTGEVQTVKYQELIPMLLNELQRQQQAINRQEQELSEMSVLRKEDGRVEGSVGTGARDGCVLTLEADDSPILV